MSFQNSKRMVWADCRAWKMDGRKDYRWSKVYEGKKVDDAHPSVPDVEDLKSKVTVSVQDYIAAVEEAFKNAK